jgi:hypothetical protein
LCRLLQGILHTPALAVGMTIRAFRHLETTTPVVHTCPRCRRPVIYGLAEGVIARCDPGPLVGDLAEELVIAAGLQTYTLQRAGLVHRDASRRCDPTLRGPVLASHDCPVKELL